MHGKYILVLLCFFVCQTSYSQDTITLEEIKVSSSVKLYSIDSLSFLSNNFSASYINRHNVKDFKDFSSLSPSLFIPDYGSKITSSVYLRGIGSRIDNSSVGICLDGVSLLNKNCFDFSYFDLKKVEILKGSQSLLFGVNTLAGVINISTLSPFDFQGIKTSLSLGNKNMYSLNLSLYKKRNINFAYMFGINAISTQGFFNNEYNNKNADWLRDVNLRFITEYKNKNLIVKNASYLSIVHQGGYAYAKYDTIFSIAYPINYNDPSYYDRINLINNTFVDYKKDNIFSLQSATSLQVNFDKMVLDNDFTDRSIFILEQKEKDYALSEEFIIKDDYKSSVWHWTLGTYFFYKYLDMKAPVTFKEEGLEKLILNNVNYGLQASGIFSPDIRMSFLQDRMKVKNNFTCPRLGYALYGEIIYKYKKIDFTFGLRIDREKVLLTYNNFAQIDYILQGIMQEYKPLITTLKGSDDKTYTELLPKFSVIYNFKRNNLFVSLSKGYMTGGYNTQMFADIIQNALMQNMFSALGITAEGNSALQNIYANYDKDEIIYYKPQYFWNYEIGGHFYLFNRHLNLNASLFYMDIRNQQLTVFLTPQTSGRMMTNAGKSFSMGGEISSTININNLNIFLGYSYTRAKFVKYNDGKADYKNKYLTYYPINTLSVCLDYNIGINKKYLDYINLSVTYLGMGKIYFNLTNTLSQSYYSLINNDITLGKNNYSLSFWLRNLFNTSYHTFYFLSTNNNFVSKGKPLSFGISFKYNI